MSPQPSLSKSDNELPAEKLMLLTVVEGLGVVLSVIPLILALELSLISSLSIGTIAWKQSVQYTPIILLFGC